MTAVHAKEDALFCLGFWCLLQNDVAADYRDSVNKQNWGCQGLGLIYMFRHTQAGHNGPTSKAQDNSLAAKD